MTLEFLSPRSGFARFLGVRDPSGVTVCGTYVFAFADGTLVLESPRLPSRTFDVVGDVDDDSFVLNSGDETLTMTRISGTGPVEECGRATAEIVAGLPTRQGSWSNLNAYGDTLYLNLPSTGNPIVGYSLFADELGAERTYTQSAGGGIDRWVVAARSHSLFYGQCACGGSNRIGYFNLETDTLIHQVDTDADLGARISVRYGYFRDGELVIGGSATGVSNRLLALDPDTLALVSQRDVLQGTTLRDITIHEGTMLGLVNVGGPALVAIAANGVATTTYLLPALQGLNAFGLTSTGADLYVAAVDTAVDTVYLFVVELE